MMDLYTLNISIYICVCVSKCFFKKETAIFGEERKKERNVTEHGIKVISFW